MGAETLTYITPSFYSSVMYWKKKEESDIQELLDLLDHKPPETTEIMQAGIDFEDDVLKVCNGGYVSEDNVANEIAEIVKGALWQVPIKTQVEVDGKPLLIFGRMDCFKRDWIYDIKRVLRYELGKYYDSIQHLSYMKARDTKKFQYLVKCGNSLYTETYYWDNNSDDLLRQRASDLIHWLKSINLYDRYAEHWKIKGEIK